MEASIDKMVIEVWSDVACPYCFIGKRKFESALEQFPEKDLVEIIWKSFQLSPEMKTDPNKNIYQYLCDSKGINIEEAREMTYFAEESAKCAGLTINFDRVIPANTLKAHLLLHFSKHFGKQKEVKELLFKAHFTEGKNIDDNLFLIETGRQVGLNAESLSMAFEDEHFMDAVREDIYESVQLEIRGVPFFVFDGKYAVSGAQDSVVFLRTLEKAFSGWRERNPETVLEIMGGETCSPDDNCQQN